MAKRKKPQGNSRFSPTQDKSRQHIQVPATLPKEGDNDAGLTVD